MADRRRLAIHALRDCGVIRTGAGRPEYGGLVSEGIADVERILTNGVYAYHYRLTAHGRALAAQVLK